MDLFGRRKLFTVENDITSENVANILNSVLPAHVQNMAQEEYLYRYRRGVQPILSRTKNVRPEINNIVTENHANEIVAFNNGYFLTQPAFYVSRSEDTDAVKRMNDYLYLCGKQQADNDVVDWFHTVGIGVLYVYPYANDTECPVRAVALDPRSSFVVYDRRPGNEPVMGVNIVVDKDIAYFDVYTRKRYFKVYGTVHSSATDERPVIMTASRVMEEKQNTVGEIPLIEYTYDTNRMGAFESVVPLLDAINNVQSNRLDGIEQFIQSLMVFYNCTLGEDDDGKQITPAMVREYGAIFLKSIGMDKADLKILSEQLDQTQTQVLVDYLYQQVLTICGMPSTTKGGTSTSDTGAAVLYRDGWYQADTYARNTEDLFARANKYFDRVFVKILRLKCGLDVAMSDFKLQFVRNETANILVKTQAALNLKQLGFSPELAFAKSGLSNDPIMDVEKSGEYMKNAWSAEQQEVKKTEENLNEN